MGRVQFTRDTTQLKSIRFSLVVVNGEHRRILLFSVRDSGVIFLLRFSTGFHLIRLSGN
jgi:hypothetical protein